MRAMERLYRDDQGACVRLAMKATDTRPQQGQSELVFSLDPLAHGGFGDALLERIVFKERKRRSGALRWL